MFQFSKNSSTYIDLRTEILHRLNSLFRCLFRVWALVYNKGRQSFTVKEPFGPVSHNKESYESHNNSMEPTGHKCFPKKKVSPVVRGIDLSIIAHSPASKNSKRATCGSGAAGCRPLVYTIRTHQNT